MNIIKFGNGVKAPVRFGMGALMAFEKEVGKSALDFFIEMAGGKASMTDIVTIVMCGLNNAARYDKTGRSYDLDEVADMIDGAPDGFLERIMTLFADSMPKPSSEKKRMLTDQTEQTE